MKKIRGTDFLQRDSRTIPVSFLGQHRSGLENCTKSLSLALNRYLWLHGIGFEHGVDFAGEHVLATFISLLFFVIAEGNFALQLCRISGNIIFGSEIKHNLFTLVYLCLNCLIRLLFYTRRRKMQSSLRELCNVYSELGRDETPLKKFKFKLITTLLASDVISCYFTFSFLYSFTSKVTETYHFGFINYPYAVPTLWLSYFSDKYFTVTEAFVAFFSAVCFILKEFLTEFSERLKNSNELEIEQLSKLYLEVSSVVSSINCLIHPQLVAVLSLILICIFRHAYYAIFSSSGYRNIQAQDTFHSLFYFSQFVCLCLFGSSFINAISNVKATALALTVKLSQPKNLPFLTVMKEGVEGFKILNSIVIDASLILSAISILLTYGILIAAFNSNNSP